MTDGSFRLPTLADSEPRIGQRIAAAAVSVVVVLGTLLLLPLAAQPMAMMPGFLAANQASLVVVYALTTAVILSQYRRTGSTSLLVLGAGSLYTTLIVTAQLLSFPNLLAQGRLFGASPDTTTWLWTFWHLGPPLFALLYAVLERGGGARPVARRRVAAFGWAAILGGAVLAGLAMTAALHAVAWLPRTVDGDDYSLLVTSGVGPAVACLTLAALMLLCWTTRLRTLLQLWLAVALLLLTVDGVITLAGSARATIGWMAGRIEALVAGVAVLGVYLGQLDLLYARAERTARERDTERAALQRARDALAFALDAADMGEWDLDLSGGASRCNAKHDEIFGRRGTETPWNRAALLGQALPEDRAALAAAVQRATSSGVLDLECRIARLDDKAQRWIAIKGKAHADAGGLLTGVVMDTTERHAAQERLNQAQKMEAIGQLTGGVAHDFNNLLTIIVGNLDMIARRPENAPRVLRLAESCLTAAQRGAEVTQKLLAFSRRQVLKPETINPNGRLTAFRPLLLRAVGASVAVDFDLDPSLHPVRLDPGQFESAILNLAVNARDAMPEGGRLSITTGNVALAPDDLSDLPELAPGDHVVVTVADTGSGIAETILPRVFEPFFTTKDVGKGTGLGLSQVYGFAKQAGGHLRIRSAPGQGTAVSMYLPRSSERPVTREDVRGVPLRRAAEGEVVLVVEDEAAVLDMAVESLTELGYATRTATDAAQALSLLRGPERIDILFSDVMMPGGMNGVQLGVEAARLRPALRILLTSGYPGATVAAEGLPDEVPLLTKPYLRGDLADRLRVVLGRG